MRERRWYQKDCAEYSACHPCAGIFMDKRLGKIAASFDWAIHHKLRNILVVAPKSAIPGWLDDGEADELNVIHLDGSKRDRIKAFLDAAEADGLGDADVPTFYITNSEGTFSPAGRRVVCETCGGSGNQGTNLSGQRNPCSGCGGQGRLRPGQPIPTEIALLPWDGIIWDETVHIRNPKAQVTQVAHAVFGRIQYRCGLSGEFAPEGIENCFEQMRWIFGSFMGYRNYYRWRHAFFDNAGYDWALKPGARQTIRDAIHQRCYVLSRADAGLKEVKNFERRWCDLPQKVRQAYDHAERYFELPYDNDGAPVETKYGVVSKTWLSQVAGGYPPDHNDLHSDHKLRLLLELMEVYKHEPLVILFRFNAELKAVAEAFKRKGIVFAYIIGETPVEERRRRQHLLQSGKLAAMLLQIKVAKYGLTLSRSSTMVRYSLTDPWDDISQSMDRIVDPMKPDPLGYIDLCARDTVDEDRLNALGDKNVDSRYYLRAFKDNYQQRKKLKELMCAK